MRGERSAALMLALVLVALCVVLLRSQTASGRRSNGVDLVVCKAVDGGSGTGLYQSDGTPVFYGIPPATVVFYFEVEGIAFTLIPGSAPQGNCVVAGTFARNETVTVQELYPTNGVAVSSIVTTPENRSSASLAVRTATIRLAKSPTTVTFTNQLICRTNWSNSGSMSVGGLCWEIAEGLLSVEAISTQNATVSIDPVVTGTTEAVQFAATKINADQRGYVTLEAVTSRGIRAQLTFDIN